MYKLTYAKRAWIAKQMLQGKPIGQIALAQKVSRITVWKILQSYKEFGWDGLKDHVTGRSETTLNANAQVIITDLRKRFGYGACRIEQLLKQ